MKFTAIAMKETRLIPIYTGKSQTVIDAMSQNNIARIQFRLRNLLKSRRTSADCPNMEIICRRNNINVPYTISH